MKLSKKYRNHYAVDRIDLNIQSGEIFGFLGPNGAGKTTTIKMLSGLLKPSSGDIILDSESIIKSGFEWKRKIGLVSEEAILFEGMTIYDHIIMAGYLYQLTDTEVEQRGNELLDFLDLLQDKDVYIKESSHGMRKKLAFALALIHKPGILFLDEALSGIDPVTGKRIRDLLKKLAAKGATIFITSHTLDVIEKLINNFAIIDTGKIAFESSMQEITTNNKSIEDVYIETVKTDREKPELSWLY